jgi:hypothetical protein
MDTNTDKRSLTRVEYGAHAIVKSTKRKKSIKAIVRDVSLDSIYLFCQPELTINERVSLEIVLLGNDSELIIKTTAKVKRIDQKGTALTFFKPLEWWPIFSYFPLKRLDDGAATLFWLNQQR